MTTTIDGFQLLKSIGQNETLFLSIEKDVNKAGFNLAKKYLKSKGLDLVSLRAFRAAITDKVLLLLFDGFAPKEIRAITKKLDKYYPNVAETDVATLRSHLYRLASSPLAPYPKPAPATRSKKPASNKGTPATKARGAKWAESMEAKPSRRREG
jgi:hypothetical protein